MARRKPVSLVPAGHSMEDPQLGSPWDRLAFPVRPPAETTYIPPANKAFLARHLLYCTLPHRDPGDVPSWGRRSGKLSVMIKPHCDEHTGAPMYPYGTLPRLLLYWIVTEALLNKQEARRTGAAVSRRIYLGPSFNAFARTLGLDGTNGGPRSVRSRLKSQMVRLFQSTITFSESDGKHYSWKNMPFSDSGSLWWTSSLNDTLQAGLFDSYIDLGEFFFEAITNSPIPANKQCLSQLKNSSLALDVYGWVVVKTWEADNRKDYVPDLITWSSLKEQLGSDYARERRFREEIITALKRIAVVYPCVNIQLVKEGMLVRPSLIALKNTIS